MEKRFRGLEQTVLTAAQCWNQVVQWLHKERKRHNHPLISLGFVRHNDMYFEVFSSLLPYKVYSQDFWVKLIIV